MNIVGRRTLRSALEYRVRTHPDRTFLVFEDGGGGVQRFTWAEFDASVNRTAHLLRTLGVGRGDTFNVHLPNCPEFLFFWFAGAKLGAVMVPTNVAEPANAMQYLLDFSGCRVAVTQPEYLGAIAEVRGACAALRHVVLCRTAKGEPDTLVYDAIVAAQPAELPDFGITPAYRSEACTAASAAHPQPFTVSPVK